MLKKIFEILQEAYPSKHCTNAVLSSKIYSLLGENELGVSASNSEHGVYTMLGNGMRSDQTQDSSGEDVKSTLGNRIDFEKALAHTCVYHDHKPDYFKACKHEHVEVCECGCIRLKKS